MTPKQEIELEKAIEDIREERELFGKDLNSYQTAENDLTKTRDDSTKTLDEINKNWYVYIKARDDFKKIRKEFGTKCMDVYTKFIDIYTNTNDEINQEIAHIKQEMAHIDNDRDEATTKARDIYNNDKEEGDTKALDIYSKAISDINNTRDEVSSKSWNNHKRTLENITKSFTDSLKNMDKSEQFCFCFLKAFYKNTQSSLEKIKARDDFKKTYYANSKNWEEESKILYDTFNKSWEKDEPNWYELRRVEKKYNLSPEHVIDSLKNWFESMQIFSDSNNKELLTQKKVNESKKELWTKLNKLSEVMSISLKRFTNILNLKEQKKLVKNYFNISRKLKKESKIIKNDLKNFNNKIDDLNLKFIALSVFLKKNLIILDEEKKVMENYKSNWDANNMDEISKNIDESGKVWTRISSDELREEREKAGQLEKTLKEGLLKETKRTLKYVIQFLGKEPKAKEIHQEFLKAYEEIEKFYELLNE